ncbi:MAG: tetratricopeptide repeat protein [Bacteroidetes bacterium]|nr:tetratricopeptide repeat protein [Bacteroidota bacterium]
MIKKNFHIPATLTLLLLFFCSIVITAQQNNIAEKDLIKQANKLFERDEWEKALPLFAQLVSVYPEKPDYNFKLGVCTLMGDRSDRKRPIRYLRKAYSDMTSNKEVLFYLGLAYYQNQEYDNAIQYFQMYQAKTDPDSPEGKKTFDLVNACQNGSELKNKNMIAEIISKNEFQLSNYHRAYPVDEINGALIQKPAQFMSSKESQTDHIEFVYVSEVKGILYFSGFDLNSNNRDIFSVTYDDEGNWDEPMKVKGGINSYYDEDYPVIADQGMTLYFCSRGHNSLGGYDIFRSKLDTISGRFGEPENLGNGINSPFDDILFIPDKTGEYAFFASNRDNLHDGIDVYKVRLMKDDEIRSNMLAAQLKANDNSIGIAFDDKRSETLNPEHRNDNLSPKPTMKESSVQLTQTDTENPNNQNNPSMAQSKSNADKQTYKNEQIKVYDPVNPVQTKDDVSELTAMNETLEINLNTDDNPELEDHKSAADAEQLPPVKTSIAATPVEPVKYGGTSKDLNSIDETLEINLNTEKDSKVVAEIATATSDATSSNKSIVADTFAEPVISNDNALATSETNEVPENHTDKENKTTMETNPTVGQAQSNKNTIAATLVEKVYSSEEPSNMDIPDEPIHITLIEDHEKMPIEDFKGNPEITETMKNNFIESLRSKIYEEPVEYTAITCSNTDKTHAELIRTARSNPDNLSYEELLMAADLIPSPFEKLNLYRVAFIHIDRDWRAYYNASQVAKEIVQMDEAQVYQYQASLISGDDELAILDIETFLWNLFSEFDLLTYKE